MEFANAGLKTPTMEKAVMEQFILVLAAAKAEPKIQHALEGVTIVKEIYVPGKIVNLVVK